MSSWVCIDTNEDDLSWTSFCGRIRNEQVVGSGINIINLCICSLNNYSTDNSSIVWCKDCVNDPRLPLKLLDNLEI